MNIRELPNLKKIYRVDGEYTNFAIIVNDSIKKGLVNRTGEIIIPPEYKIILRGVVPHEFLLVGKRGLQYYDIQTQQFIPQLTSDWEKKEESIVVYKNREGLSGIQDKMTGEVILPATYESLYIIDNNHIIIENASHLEGCVDIRGNELIPPIYTSLHYVIPHHCYEARDCNQKVGLLSEDGAIIVPFEYDELFVSISDGLNIISVKKGGECFFINAKEEKIKLF